MFSILIDLLMGVSPYIIYKLYTTNKKNYILLYLVVAILVGAMLYKEVLELETDKMMAEYEARFHIITFDTDGGKAISPMKVQSFGGISNIRAEKDGYIFTGWLLNGQPIENLILTEDVTIKATYKDLRPTQEQLASAKKIDYRTLYKGSSSLYGNFYKVTGEIVQNLGDNIFHVNMTKNGSYYEYYTDRIQIEIKGKTSEILMVGDVISFTGKFLGNTTYTTVLISENTIPSFEVYPENLKVVGYTN